MKILIISLSAVILTISSLNAEEKKCDTFLAKLKPSCNFIGKGGEVSGKSGKMLGKGVENMKAFSKKNKTLDQSGENIKKAITK